MSSLREAVEVAVGGEPADVELVDDVEQGAAPAHASSVLGAVRSRAQQLQVQTTVELPLPGYDNLVGSYRAVSIAKYYSVNGGVLRNPLTEWGVAADALATALVTLYGVDARGELVDLYESGDPARYDEELAEALGVHPDGKTARAVLVAVLGGGELGQSRVWSHYLSYQNWLMEGPAQEVAEEALGER